MELLNLGHKKLIQKYQQKYQKYIGGVCMFGWGMGVRRGRGGGGGGGIIKLGTSWGPT